MGLDIRYCSGAKKIDCVYDADGEPLDAITHKPIDGDWERPYKNPDFPGRADDVDSLGIYLVEGAASFRAGSYSSYSYWREQLAELAGYARTETRRYQFSPPELRCDETAFLAEGGPFWEHICFSDCEGVIGAVISSKLACDYAEHQAKADAHGEPMFRELYARWRKAFETASHGGFVIFR